MSKSNNSARTIAIIAMFFLFAMISFVTNLAAPIGTIWGFQFEGNSFLGMLGNMMNFLAYLFMGIPAGKLLTKIGYKKTALWAIAIGAIGLAVQWVSGVFGGEIHVASSTVTVHETINGVEYPVTKEIGVNLNFIIYLLGAFIAGFCVCMLNTVVNPMLNLLGDGGNKGNQLIQTGGALNSLSATLSPFLVGALIGQLTRSTAMSDVAPLLWIGIGIFVAAFIIICFVAIPEPSLGSGKKVKYSHSPWSFRHFVFGAIAIFFYVGVEIGIPGTLNFYLSDQKPGGAEILGDASAIAGAIVAIYWLLMLVGRFTSSIISGKVSTKTQLVSVSAVCICLIGLAIFSSKESKVDVPNFIYNPVEKTTATLASAGMPQGEIDEFIANPTVEKIAPYTEVQIIPTDIGDVEKTVVANSSREPVEIIQGVQARPSIPYAALFLILCGLCTSVMWGGIFNLAVEGLGKYIAQASGIFMMMVVGGGVIPLLQQLLVKHAGYMESYYLIMGAVAYIFFFAVWGCTNVNKDIPVDFDEEEKAEEENVKEEIALVD